MAGILFGSPFIIIVILLTFLLVLLLFVDNYSNISVIKKFYSFGTIIQIEAYGKNAEKAIDEAAEKLQHIDDEMSVFKESSDVSNINRNAGIQFQQVDEETYYVIKKAAEYGEISNGAFDVTIRPLVKLWGIGSDNARIPDKKDINVTKRLIDYKDILFDEKNCSIKLSRINQELDLGGIAKGFAADNIKSILRKNGIKKGIIDLGGNIYALGGKRFGKGWDIGIQDPFETRGKYLGFINVSNKSIVTSGNYERYSLINGQYFQHIIDPKTGYPSDSNIVSATIISDLSIDGDGLSTGVYIIGIDKALKLIESIKNVEAIFITKSKEIYMTSGLKSKFKLTNGDFIIKNNNENNTEVQNENKNIQTANI